MNFESCPYQKEKDALWLYNVAPLQMVQGSHSLFWR